MTATHTTYELGSRIRLTANFTNAICWKRGTVIEGVSAYARDGRTGEYVRVYEVGPTEWVDNEPQAWSSGNFETVEDAKRFASKAYRWINRGR